MKRLLSVFLGILVVACTAATLGSDAYLQLTNNTTAPTTSTVPSGRALLWMENGTLKTKVGTAVSTVGSGVGGGSTEWKQIWPPSSITNPTVGMKTLGPLIAGYLPDSVFQAAEYTPRGWRYETLRSGPF